MSKEQEKFNKRYSNKKKIDISKGLFESTKLESSLEIKGFKILEVIKLNGFKLNSLKIINCPQLNKVSLSNLTKLTILSVGNCPKLTELDCSPIETLTELEVSDLIVLDCSNTLVEELSLNLCPNIKTLICRNNKKLNKLDLSNCSKLDSLDCTGSKLTRLDYCPNSATVIPPELIIITREIKNFRNILIVGHTGAGISTLANVLADTDKFKESPYGVSETMCSEEKECKWNDINFRVVDTVGVEHTNLDVRKILRRIKEGNDLMPEGISQVLFVVKNGNLTNEIDTFKIFKDSIFGMDSRDCITIVRTNFRHFKNGEKCGIDKEKMLSENKAIAEIIKSCNVIHVDNPPTNIEVDDDYKRQISINETARKKREFSRKIMREYLKNVRPIKENKYFKLVR